MLLLVDAFLTKRSFFQGLYTKAVHLIFNQGIYLIKLLFSSKTIHGGRFLCVLHFPFCQSIQYSYHLLINYSSYQKRMC